MNIPMSHWVGVTTLLGPDLDGRELEDLKAHALIFDQILFTDEHDDDFDTANDESLRTFAERQWLTGAEILVPSTKITTEATSLILPGALEELIDVIDDLDPRSAGGFEVQSDEWGGGPAVVEGC